MDGDRGKRWNMVETQLKAIKSNATIKDTDRTELVYDLKNLWTSGS